MTVTAPASDLVRTRIEEGAGTPLGAVAELAALTEVPAGAPGARLNDAV
jgi:hypothetical protein